MQTFTLSLRMELVIFEVEGDTCLVHRTHSGFKDGQPVRLSLRAGRKHWKELLDCGHTVC